MSGLPHGRREVAPKPSLQSTGAQSKSQEQGQLQQQSLLENTNSTQHRDPQPTSVPNASNN